MTTTEEAAGVFEGLCKNAQTVNGVVDTKMITVTWDAPATWDTIADKMKEIEYAPAE